MPLSALSTDVTSSCGLTVCLVYQCPIEVYAAMQIAVHLD